MIASARIALWSVVAVAGLMLALFVYVLFIAYPSITSTGDANLQVWVGPELARWGYLLLGLLLFGSYATVAFAAGHRNEQVNAATVTIGAAVGWGSGQIVAATLVVSSLLAAAPSDLAAAAVVPYVVMFVTPIVAGGIVGRRSGRTRLAMLGGFWCGLVLALVVAVALNLRDLLLAERLMNGAWLGDVVGDATCTDVSGTVLAECEIGDDLGAAAAQMLVGPLVAIPLGALGGAAGRMFATSRTALPNNWVSSVASLLVFCLTMLILFSAEVAFKIW
jgi:hypothetical protein